MSRYDRKYDAFQIFEKLREHSETEPSFLPEKILRETTPPDASLQKSGSKNLSHEDMQSGGAENFHSSISSTRTVSQARACDGQEDYYEIEYDSCPMPGVGRFVLKSQRVDAPVKDEIREIFDQMRDIAREYRTSFYCNNKFYDRRAQQENSRIFYRQGLFMKDFEDEYPNSVPYSSYFPYYQMMGYEQLRTYFTWRTRVRRGTVTDTSPAYAYLYLYELLNHIGVENPQDGLDKLIFFWKEFRVFHPSIDRYVLKWLKDYYIYYDLPLSFQTFVEQNELTEYYRELSEPRDNLELLCSISKYDIRKSVFYTGEQEKLIKDCLYYTLDRLRLSFAENDMDFDNFIFQPTKNLTSWTPFKDALFYPCLKQRDRRVVFSEKEIYLCSQNKWQYSTSITSESGRQLMGYILKQTEAALRQAVSYKYKLTANIHNLHPVTAAQLLAAGISLEEEITAAVAEFYREATKTVVNVNPAALERIRQEALLTQERLIVPEEETVSPPQLKTVGAPPEKPAFVSASGFSGPDDETTLCEALSFNSVDKAAVFNGAAPPASANVTVQAPAAGADPWMALKHALGETGLTALSVLLKGETNIKTFADTRGMMLEVLMDEINEKAMDFVGDSLVDEEFTIYEDYREQVRGMVEQDDRTGTYKNCQ